MKKPILNIADAAVDHSLDHSGVFEMRMADLSDRFGATQIGVNVTTVPPGKAAFPFHHHYANEEHFFVVRGSGRLRYGEQVHAVRTGDYIYTAPGDAAHAHQMINDGSEDLVYLAWSTRLSPEVVGYPDSAKLGVTTGIYGTPNFERRLFPQGQGAAIDYWDGEDGSAVRALPNLQQQK